MLIYKVINQVNGMHYIGQTRGVLQDRWVSHSHISESPGPRSYLQEAIVEFGVENFTVEIIEFCKSFHELNVREKYWIRYYDSLTNGYNRTCGGGANGAIIRSPVICHRVNGYFADPEKADRYKAKVEMERLRQQAALCRQANYLLA